MIINIVANPLTLLSPKTNIIIATNKVVRFESTIVLKLDLLPILKASGKLFPFLSSSFTLSYNDTLASIAIPIPSIKAAIPGRVNTPPTNQNVPKTKNVYRIIDIADKIPQKWYKTNNRKIIKAIPITPAIKVFCKVASPNDAPTVLLDNSVNLVGRLPEFIKSTKFCTSSSVKSPWIITSLAKACDTLAADKQWLSLVPHDDDSLE